MSTRGLARRITTYCRVRHYAVEKNRRMRPRLKTSGKSYRVNETYAEVDIE